MANMTLADKEAERKDLLKAAHSEGLLSAAYHIVMDDLNFAYFYGREYHYTIHGRMLLVVIGSMQPDGEIANNLRDRRRTRYYKVMIYWLPEGVEENDFFAIRKQGELVCMAAFNDDKVFDGADYFISRGDWWETLGAAGDATRGKMIKMAQNAQGAQAVAIERKLAAYERVAA